MRRIAGRFAKKIGLPPGTTIHTGEHKMEPVPVAQFIYNETECREQTVANLADYQTTEGKNKITWLNIDGVHDVNVLNRVERIFALHPLVMEDIANTVQRPKIDEYESYLYLSLRMLSIEAESFLIDSEQVSLVIGDDFLISFQEKSGDVFELIRNRLRQGKGRIRKTGSDYLMYSLLDAIVDHYFLILENLEEHIQQIEEEVGEDPKVSTLEKIHKVKKEIIFLRRSTWPIREIAGKLERLETALISSETKLFLRDLYDHIIQIIEITESFQDIVSSLLDLYLSSASNRMNNIMKVLTLVATIFIPLTFLAGIYGMNFRFMPELEWRWGYPTLIGIMLAAGVAMVLYFKRKRWF
jgi:magnesium transporter